MRRFGSKKKSLHAVKEVACVIWNCKDLELVVARAPKRGRLTSPSCFIGHKSYRERKCTSYKHQPWRPIAETCTGEVDLGQGEGAL